MNNLHNWWKTKRYWIQWMNLLSYFPILLGDGITTLHKFNLLLMKNQDYLSFKNAFFFPPLLPYEKILQYHLSRFRICALTSVQSLSRVPLFATPWIAACQASLSITSSRNSLRLNVHQVSDAIQPSHPLLSLSPPAPNPSQHQSLFQWVNSSQEVAKGLEFQL